MDHTHVTYRLTGGAAPEASPAVERVYVQTRHVSRRSVLVWALIIVVGVAFELFTLASPDDGWEPLTWVTVAFVPPAWAFAFISWLKSHFTQAYAVGPDDQP